QPTVQLHIYPSASTITDANHARLIHNCHRHALNVESIRTQKTSALPSKTAKAHGRRSGAQPKYQRPAHTRTGITWNAGPASAGIPGRHAWNPQSRPSPSEQRWFEPPRRRHNPAVHQELDVSELGRRKHLDHALKAHRLIERFGTG